MKGKRGASGRYYTTLTESRSETPREAKTKAAFYKELSDRSPANYPTLGVSAKHADFEYTNKSSEAFADSNKQSLESAARLGKQGIKRLADRYVREHKRKK